MANNRKYFFAKSATITFTTDGGTAIAVGHLQNVKINRTADMVDLRSASSTKRQDVGQSNQAIPISAEVKSIDAELLGDILSPTGANWTTGTATLSSLEDVQYPAFFDIEAAVDDTSGKALTVTVKNVVFADLPILVGNADEWVGWPIEGVGDDLTIVESTS
jgi:hypothetical protein